MLLFKTYLLHVEQYKQQYKHKLKIIVRTQSDEFELQYGSYLVTDLQDYIQ